MSFLISFLVGVGLGFVGSIPAAGPLAILIVTAALDRARPRAARLAIGGALAEGIWAAVALLGIERVVHAGALRVVQAVGAVVLIVLGALMLRAPRSKKNTETSPAHAIVGFVIVATNPGFLVAWLGFAAAIATFGRFSAVPTALGAVVGIVAWFATLYALVARFSVREETLRRITRALGIAVIGFGIAIAVSLLR